MGRLKYSFINMTHLTTSSENLYTGHISDEDKLTIKVPINAKKIFSAYTYSMHVQYRSIDVQATCCKSNTKFVSTYVVCIVNVEKDNCNK